MQVRRVGSPGYIAPEMFTKANEPDGKGRGRLGADLQLKLKSNQLSAIDIYSCGASIYEMLIGISPRRNFAQVKAALDARARSCAGWRRAGTHVVLRHPSELSADARDFLLALMQVDAARRPSARGAMELPFLRAKV